MPEIKRRNGYYLNDDIHYPSVSTVMKSAGSPAGLIDWAAVQGGHGVLWALAKIGDTEKLKEKLSLSSCVEWASDVAKQGLEASSERVTSFGSRVHYLIEDYLRQRDTYVKDVTEEENKALITFKTFWEEVQPHSEAIEEEVISHTHRYAGRADAVIKIDDSQANVINTYLKRTSEKVQPGLIMTDYKTGRLYPKSLKVQLSAYAKAYEEGNKKEINGGLVIGIDRDDRSKLKCVFFSKEVLASAFEQGFLTAYQAWHYWDAPLWWKKQWEDK